jgi:hypothetical protein
MALNPRVLLSGDRILITKPSYPAVEGVPDEGKVFDSRWDFTGTLIGRGPILDTSQPNAPGSTLTSDGSPQQVAIPLAFTPREVLFLIYIATSQGAPIRNFTTLAASRFSFNNGILSINRQQYPGSNPPTYLRTDYVYRAYSI